MSDGSRIEQYNGDFKYWAFISYSHADKNWAGWVHRGLESYRVPAKLVGRPSRDGMMPRRLFPVFRDREELPTSADLGSAIRDALFRSRYLIVVCSSRAAVSRWVNEEVRQFKEFGRSDRVLCLIVDGEPNVTDSPKCGSLECFPPAIRFSVDEQGKLTDDRVEPIAADVRSGGDGRMDARLKLLAGVLGADFDQLKQRERHRRKVVWWTRVALAVVIIGLFTGAYMNAQARRRADLARYHRDQLIERGRQELLNGDSAKALPWLSAAYSTGATDAPLRFMLAEALRPGRALELKLDRSVKERILWAHVLPDGAHFVTGHADKTVRLREISTGKVLSQFTALGERTDLYGLSPDGQRFVATRDVTATVWNLRSGAVEHVLRGHDLTIRAVAFSLDGNLLATASADNTAVIWNLGSGERTQVFQGHTATIRAVIFSPNGKVLATGGLDESVKLWDVQKGTLLRSLDDQGATVEHLAYFRDGSRLAVFGRDSRVSVWETRSGSLLGQSPTGLVALAANLDHVASQAVAVVTRRPAKASWLLDLTTGQKLGDLRSQLAAADFSPDGRQILYENSALRTVELSDASTGRLLLSLPSSHSLSPLDVAMNQIEFDESGSRVVTVSATGELSIWRVTTTLPFETGTQPEFAGGAFFDRAGQNVIVVFPHAIVICDAHTRARLASWMTESFLVKQVSFDNREGRMAIAGSDGAIHIWSFRTSAAETSLPGRSAQLSPDSKTGVIARADRSVALFDPATGAISRVPTPEVANVSKHSATDAGVHVEFSTDSERVLTASGNEGTKVFSVRSGQKLWTSPSNLSVDIGYTAHFRPDGNAVFLAGRSGGKLWDLSKDRLIAGVAGDAWFGITGAGFSTDGKWLFSAGSGVVKILSASSGALEATLDCGGDSLSFHPGGELAMTARAHGRIQVWSVKDARLLSVFEGEDAQFAPDGETILIGGHSASSRSFQLENRPAASVAASAALQSPWRLDGNHLVTSDRDASAILPVRTSPAPQSPTPAASPP